MVHGSACWYNSRKQGGTLNLKNVSLEGCNFDKAGLDVVDQLIKKDASPEFSGSFEGYYKYLLDNELVDGEAKVAVMVRISSGTDWKDAIVNGMEVLVGGTIFGAIINFEALIALLKNHDVLSISWSAPTSGVE